MMLASHEFEGAAVLYEIRLLDLIDIEAEASFLVLAHDIGKVARAKCWGYLILGGDDPILVDTGVSDPEILARLGMTGFEPAREARRLTGGHPLRAPHAHAHRPRRSG